MGADCAADADPWASWLTPGGCFPRRDQCDVQPLCARAAAEVPVRRVHLRPKGTLNTAAYLDFVVEIIRRSDNQKGFQVLPQLSVVERSFGWMIQLRRLARDCEQRAARY